MVFDNWKIQTTADIACPQIGGILKTLARGIHVRIVENKIYTQRAGNNESVNTLSKNPKTNQCAMCNES